MSNIFFLTGKLREKEEKENYFILGIEVRESYKNADGEYETYILKVKVNNNIGCKIEKYCNIGDLIGCRGSISKNNELIANKISFLSNNKEALGENEQK